MTDNQLDRSQDSHTYLYDTAQRFTKMERGTIGGTPSFYQGYTLDALANWSSFNNNGTTESRSHDVMNAITFRGATSLSHDLNGNLTNDGNQKYIWDELNRLVEVRDSGNNIICDYYYNADNLRVEKHHAGGAKEQFYYDGATVLVETDGSQTKMREYVNGGQYIDEVILVANGSTYNYYMSDLRYCVTGFVDSTGAVVERSKYDGYGKRTLLDASYATITTANVDQSYGYTGIRHDDESGLQYYRARYFDNTLGRFINRDPLGYVDGLGLYNGYFVPRWVDPFGLSARTWITKHIKAGIEQARHQGRYQVEDKKVWKKYLGKNLEVGVKYGLTATVSMRKSADDLCVVVTGYGSLFGQFKIPIPYTAGLVTLIIEPSFNVGGRVTCCTCPDPNQSGGFKLDLAGETYYCRGDVNFTFGVKVGLRLGISNNGVLEVFGEAGGFIGGTYSFRRNEWNLVGFLYLRVVAQVDILGWKRARSIEYRVGSSVEF